MNDRPRPSMRRRRVPGTDRGLSEVTISLDPPAVASPALDARVVELLRRARSRGVTTFDVADARYPARAERLIATAFPEAAADVGVVVGRSTRSLSGERTPRGDPFRSRDLESALEESLEQSRRRLAPVPITILEWTPTTEEGRVGTGDETLPPARIHGRSDFEWALRLPPHSVGASESSGAPTVLSGELSLLDRELVARFEEGGTKSEKRLIARNPFSDGRLDGSRFAAATAPTSPGSGPIEIRRLEAEFAPVLALGFLTESRTRTLAQAALSYVLDWPWVATAVVPLPAPERLEEVLGFRGSPSFTDEERSRLGLVK